LSELKDDLRWMIWKWVFGEVVAEAKKEYEIWFRR
jgi:hypothetical protein